MRNASGPWTGSWTRLHWPKRSETVCWERDLPIRYDGLLAAPHQMDGADSKAVIGGAQIDCSRLRGESQSLMSGVQQSASDRSNASLNPDGCMIE